jgi:hypothetical protein
LLIFLTVSQTSLCILQTCRIQLIFHLKILSNTSAVSNSHKYVLICFMIPPSLFCHSSHKFHSCICNSAHCYLQFNSGSKKRLRHHVFFILFAAMMPPDDRKR